MRHNILIGFAAAILLASAATQAPAQFIIGSQTASATTTVTGEQPVNVGGIINLNIQQPSTSGPITGASNNLSEAGGVFVGAGSTVPSYPVGTEFVSTAASMQSSAQSSGISATLESTGKAAIAAPNSVFDAQSQSSYSVNFSVSSPTEISLTESFLLTSPPQEGENATLDAAFSTNMDIAFVGTPAALGEGPIEDKGINGFTFGNSIPPGGAHPTVAALLFPGNTYSISVLVSTDTPDTDFQGPNPTATLSFTMTGTPVVPEPASVSLISGLACALLARRRRS